MKEIPLTRGFVAQVDDADFHSLNQWKWHVHEDPKNGRLYAVRQEGLGGKRQRTIWMHRQILGLHPGDRRRGDHIEPLETLNNCRSNLRAASHRQNACNRRKQANNTSGFKGVFQDKTKRKWFAAIKVAGKQHHLGTFHSREAAADAYAAAARGHHGEFARTE